LITVSLISKGRRTLTLTVDATGKERRTEIKDITAIKIRAAAREEGIKPWSAAAQAGDMLVGILADLFDPYDVVDFIEDPDGIAAITTDTTNISDALSPELPSLAAHLAAVSLVRTFAVAGATVAGRRGGQVDCDRPAVTSGVPGLYPDARTQHSGIPVTRPLGVLFLALFARLVFRAYRR
jgi:hypothetical protein